ncbi:HAMP domain-containing histidine kinase [Sulfurimonas sp. SAG-AH-194-I05]|nr:HAMP domain-containing sensor histidine kinase [Sulfurimonas sp. SAG-AH-194-I05]MDF1874253.1 HAMP domain-containing histidine kinase [Sulfurimonas sp. SAG-AH-194-I05]
MNKLERSSLYSFLLLYLGSSLFFVLLSGFWYYSAQKNALENSTYYKLQHLADRVSRLIINAHMGGRKLVLPPQEEGYEYIMIPSSLKKEYKENYFQKNGFKVLVSSAPQEHLSIQYVMTKTDMYHKNILKLQKEILVIMFIVFTFIVLISWILSKFFMRPIRDKMVHIEQFLQDISHELNTPITALKMSSKRALEKKVYDEKILTNISISTKQLYSIYQSLAYLNFSSKEEERIEQDLKPILEQSIAYYTELLMAKNISVKVELQTAPLVTAASKMELLFSNLISNAIKYSMPDTCIYITLKDGFFQIQDEGVGIAPEKVDKIFTLYERGSHVAGGFGIGLNIVKKICDGLDITIEVVSQVEKGSTFTLQW